MGAKRTSKPDNGQPSLELCVVGTRATGVCLLAAMATTYVLGGLNTPEGDCCSRHGLVPVMATRFTRPTPLQVGNCPKPNPSGELKAGLRYQVPVSLFFFFHASYNHQCKNSHRFPWNLPWGRGPGRLLSFYRDQIPVGFVTSELCRGLPGVAGFARYITQMRNLSKSHWDTWEPGVFQPPTWMVAKSISLLGNHG